MTLPKAIKAERDKRKLAASEVKRQDAGRTLAETQAARRGPGRPRKDGSPPQPKAKTVEEATARIKSAPVETTTSAPAEWRAPTAGEVAQVRFVMEMGNKPLVQLEQDLELYGIVGPPPCLAAKGAIPMSKDELDMGSQCTAGAMLALAPSILPYLAVLSFGAFTVGFIGSRLLIFWRIKRAMDAQAKADKLESDRKAGRPPLASPEAPRGELTKIGAN